MKSLLPTFQLRQVHPLLHLILTLRVQLHRFVSQVQKLQQHLCRSFLYHLMVEFKVCVSLLLVCLLFCLFSSEFLIWPFSFVNPSTTFLSTTFLGFSCIILASYTLRLFLPLWCRCTGLHTIIPTFLYSNCMCIMNKKMRNNEQKYKTE